MAKGQIKQKQSKIDQKQFESLCAIQCTEEEICAVLDVSDKTLNEWCNTRYKKNFSEVFQEKRKYGKASLRRNQWNLSQSNPTMAIWLGKQYLGQKDKFETENNMKATIEDLTPLAQMIKIEPNEREN